MTDSGRVLRLTVDFVKRKDYGHERLFGGFPGLAVGAGENQTPVLDDFEIDAAIGQLDAFRTPHHDQTGPANPHIDLDFGRCVWQWSEPLLEQVRLCPCAIDLSVAGDGLPHRRYLRDGGQMSVQDFAVAIIDEPRTQAREAKHSFREDSNEITTF